MVHTRLSTVKKNKCILPTTTDLTNDNSKINSNEASTVIKSTEYMEIVPETQTQIVDCIQASKFDFGTPESTTEDVADLEDKTATEIKKLQTLHWRIKLKGNFSYYYFYNSTFNY